MPPPRSSGPCWLLQSAGPLCAGLRCSLPPTAKAATSAARRGPVAGYRWSPPRGVLSPASPKIAMRALQPLPRHAVQRWGIVCRQRLCGGRQGVLRLGGRGCSADSAVARDGAGGAAGSRCGRCSSGAGLPDGRAVLGPPSVLWPTSPAIS